MAHMHEDGSVTLSADEHLRLIMAAIGTEEHQRVDLLTRASMLAYDIINSPETLPDLADAKHEWNAMIGSELLHSFIALSEVR